MESRADAVPEAPDLAAARPGRSVWIVLVVLAFVWSSVAAGALLSRLVHSPLAPAGAVAHPECGASSSASTG